MDSFDSIFQSILKSINEDDGCGAMTDSSVMGSYVSGPNDTYAPKDARNPFRKRKRKKLFKRS